MPVPLWQLTVLPEAMMTSGVGAVGAVPAYTTQDRPAIKMPLDASGEVAIVVRCGRILESLASAAPLTVLLSFFTPDTGSSYDIRLQCAARQPGDDGDAAAWNGVESQITGSFPAAGELVHAETAIAAGDARDNLDTDQELEVLVRLLPDGARPADFLWLLAVEVRQELPEP